MNDVIKCYAGGEGAAQSSKITPANTKKMTKESLDKAQKADKGFIEWLAYIHEENPFFIIFHRTLLATNSKYSA